MKKKIIKISILLVLAAFSEEVWAYPPAVGILGEAKNCLSCHVNNGPWRDDGLTIIDILDKETKKSLKQIDGSFLIEVRRGEKETILTVIGRSKEDREEPPYRNAWLYVDTRTIGTTSLSKFAPGWDVNLPMSCRLVGDRLEGYENAKITVLPMTIQPSDAAQDAELMLQVMPTKGESVKGKPKEGMIGNYFERKVKLKVVD
ncbi:MAG: hypothetical protein A3F87_04725 [Omnitrophica WOR_2 bacterium RIFCSPLOWO2_12_FULL_51_24]|nr:MAG: hypothetical protein A2879_05320 [Omnitrophica WOR_2 bacterium RIFCSPHIGHO2_01_FULL_49_10]OGX33228.1 MAG: hypothetical protein A3I43_06465 [Omnitrophica WOR_2 bacterium RIFCSPLOWO2_02_FULL_50_19]OGX41847.1 MAG: hypothetical protein A3F87_04725 [Omnitrophica WOR_2 bacterium RIFCSPLOWO2_12_FULL_51_24]